MQGSCGRLCGLFTAQGYTEGALREFPASTLLANSDTLLHTLAMGHAHLQAGHLLLSV